MKTMWKWWCRAGWDDDDAGGGGGGDDDDDDDDDDGNAEVAVADGCYRHDERWTIWSALDLVLTTTAIDYLIIYHDWVSVPIGWTGRGGQWYVVASSWWKPSRSENKSHCATPPSLRREGHAEAAMKFSTGQWWLQGTIAAAHTARSGAPTPPRPRLWVGGRSFGISFDTKLCEVPTHVP